MNLYWHRQTDYPDITDVPLPIDTHSIFGQVVNHYQMSLHERIILLLALAPHIMPSVLDVLFTKKATYDKAFTEFGGAKA